ncbi:MAG: hypothetical protein RLZZ624_958, partial [Cyanobacteriota bacterium]
LHMGIEQLQALEAGEGSRLPELVFVIAQARRIAGFLGLSIDPQIEALRHCPASQAAATTGDEAVGSVAPIAAEHLRLSAASAQEPLPLGERYERLEQGRLESPDPDPGPVRTWWRSLMAAILLLGAVSGGTALWRQGAVPSMAWPSPGSGAPAEPAKAPVAEGRDATPQAAATAPASVEAGVLVLRASGPSWLEVRNAAGQPLFYKTLKGEQRFPIGAGLRLTAGRPDLIQVRSAAQPARILGRIDDQLWWSIQADGRLKVLKTAPR